MDGFEDELVLVPGASSGIGLTSSVSAELAPKSIRVNMICPGIADAPKFAGYCRR